MGIGIKYRGSLKAANWSMYEADQKNEAISNFYQNWSRGLQLTKNTNYFASAGNALRVIVSGSGKWENMQDD